MRVEGVASRHSKMIQNPAPKNRSTLRSKDPLIAVENRPSLPVPDHGPVLREERFFVPTLRVQVLRSSSRIPSFSCIVTREKAESIE
jgi:hypothetical protein